MTIGKLIYFIFDATLLAVLAKAGAMLLFWWLGKRGEFFFNTPEGQSELPKATYISEMVSRWPWIVWIIGGPVLAPMIWLCVILFVIVEIMWRVRGRGPFEKGVE